MRDNADVDKLRAAKAAARQCLKDVDGVQGVGIGDGTVRVYVRDAGVAGTLPGEIEGVEVECVVVGEIVAGKVGSSQ